MLLLKIKIQQDLIERIISNIRRRRRGRSDCSRLRQRRLSSRLLHRSRLNNLTRNGRNDAILSHYRNWRLAVCSRSIRRRLSTLLLLLRRWTSRSVLTSIVNLLLLLSIFNFAHHFSTSLLIHTMFTVFLFEYILLLFCLLYNNLTLYLLYLYVNESSSLLLS